jgi:hypothetical protein
VLASSAVQVPKPDDRIAVCEKCNSNMNTVANVVRRNTATEVVARGIGGRIPVATRSGPMRAMAMVANMKIAYHGNVCAVAYANAIASPIGTLMKIKVPVGDPYVKPLAMSAYPGSSFVR